MLKKMLQFIIVISMIIGIAGCAPAAVEATEVENAVSAETPATSESEVTPEETEETATTEVEEEAPTSEVVDGGHITIGINASPDTFNPTNAKGGYATMANNIMYETLVHLDADLNPQPRLADSWEISEDSTTFTFHLNKNVKWHDGEPFTANDIAFTINRITDSRVETNRRNNVSFLVGVEGMTRPEGVDTIEGLKVIDDYTVQFISKYPIDPFFFWEQVGIWVWYLPEHLLKDVLPEDLAKADFFQNPIGNGPYKFVKYETDQYVELERNMDYYMGAPHVEKIILKILTPAAISIQLETGEIDVCAGGGAGGGVCVIPIEDWEKIKNLPNMETTSGSPDSYHYIAFNHADATRPWGEKKVRQAIAYLVNRELMVTRLLQGEGIISTSPIFPTTPYFDSASLEQYPYDLERGKALLEEAGWDPNYEVTLLVRTGSAARELAGDVIQQNLSDAGITVKIEKMDQPTMQARIGEGTYDMFLSGWGGVLDPDVRPLVYSTGQYNYGLYANAEMDALLDAGAQEANFEERKAIYKQVQELYWDDLPYIPLFWPNALVAVNSRVVNVSPMVGSHTLERNIIDWYVTDGQ